jgi:hypothetical protein
VSDQYPNTYRYENLRFYVVVFCLHFCWKLNSAMGLNFNGKSDGLNKKKMQNETTEGIKGERNKQLSDKGRE